MLQTLVRDHTPQSNQPALEPAQPDLSCDLCVPAGAKPAGQLTSHLDRYSKQGAS